MAPFTKYSAEEIIAIMVLFYQSRPVLELFHWNCRLFGTWIKIISFACDAIRLNNSF